MSTVGIKMSKSRFLHRTNALFIFCNLHYWKQVSIQLHFFIVKLDRLEKAIEATHYLPTYSFLLFSLTTDMIASPFFSKNVLPISSSMWKDMVVDTRKVESKIYRLYEGSIFHDFFLVLFSSDDDHMYKRSHWLHHKPHFFWLRHAVCCKIGSSPIYGRLAQLVRAFLLHRKGRGFESLIVHQ